MNTQKELQGIAWYLTQCKPRQESRAGEYFVRLGFEYFNPAMKFETLSKWKLKSHIHPLAPKYIFNSARTQNNWTSLRATSAANSVASFADNCEYRPLANLCAQ